MAEVDMKKAKAVYTTLIEALNKEELKYREDEENLRVDLSFGTDDLDVNMIIKVDADREVIRLLSPIPAKIPDDKRVDAAIAVCVANYGMVDGSFEYDITDGQLLFKMTNSYCDSMPGTETFVYMIRCSLAMVDVYNDRFFMLAMGMMTLEQFMEKDGER